MKKALFIFYITTLIIGIIGIIGTTSCVDKDPIDGPTVCPPVTIISLTSIHLPQEHNLPFGVRFVYDDGGRLSYAYEYELANEEYEKAGVANVNDTLYGWKYVFGEMKDNIVDVKLFYRKNNQQDIWSESSISKKLYYDYYKIVKVEEYSDGTISEKETAELTWDNEKVVKRTIGGVVYGDDLISYKDGNFVDFGTKTGSTSVNNGYFQKRTIDTKSTFGTKESYLKLIPIEYMMAKDRVRLDYTFPLYLYFSNNALEKQVYSVFYENFMTDITNCTSTKMTTRTSEFVLEYNNTMLLSNFPSKVVRTDTEKEVFIDFEDESNNSEQKKTSSEYTIEFQYEIRN